MSHGVTGQEAEDLLHEVGITVNKNLIPFDELLAQQASGIRIGTPAMCSRGFGPEEAAQVADFIDRALKNKDNPEVLAAVKAEAVLCVRRSPLTNNPESHESLICGAAFGGHESSVLALNRHAAW